MTTDNPFKTQMYDGNFHPIKKRRIRLDACKKYNYKCIKINGEPAHIANYTEHGGKITAQHIRFVDNKYFQWNGQYLDTQLFGQAVWPAGGKRVVVAKGELDTLSIAQAFNLKWPVVGVPGVNHAEKFIKRNMEFLDSFDEIVLAFDNTEDSQAVTDHVGSLFSVGKVKVMSYDGYDDANHMLMENAGDRIGTQVFQAKDYRPDGIVFGDELWEEIIKKPEPGLTLPYPILQNKLQGIRPGRLHLLTAGSGIGKSTFAHELGYNLLMEHGQSVGVMALEEPKSRLAHRYLGMHMNKLIHLNHDGLAKDELRKAYDATINNRRFCLYDHWGSSHIDKLMAKLRYMAAGLEMQWVVLDHISIVVSGLDEVGESERKTIDRLMTGMRTLINETGLGMIAIVHLKRKGGKSKTYNEGGQVSITDLRGSASLEQLSDTIISLERNQQDEDNKNYARTRLLKDRDLGDTGVGDILRYHPDTGRLLPHVGADPFTKQSNPFKQEEPDDF